MAAKTRAVNAASSVYWSDVALKVNDKDPSEFKLTKAKRAVGRASSVVDKSSISSASSAWKLSSRLLADAPIASSIKQHKVVATVHFSFIIFCVAFRFQLPFPS